MTERDREFAAVFTRAHKAGAAAAEALVPRAMVVVGGEQKWTVAEGVCGFAWITIRDGRSAAAKFARKAWGAHSAYGGGTSIWVGAYNQSMERKEAYASAFARVLQEAGIAATAGSRMD